MSRFVMFTVCWNGNKWMLVTVHLYVDLGHEQQSLHVANLLTAIKRLLSNQDLPLNINRRILYFFYFCVNQNNLFMHYDSLYDFFSILQMVLKLHLFEGDCIEQVL